MASFDQRLRERIAATTVGRLLGIELSPVGHVERFVSLFGGVVGIYIMLLFESDILGQTGAVLMSGSMGSTAVLLFAVPHGALSQPWAVIVGHAVSAVVGVACARYVPDLLLASALAVGVAILAMHYTRSIHPPGGATALTAVIGGQPVHDLGFTFVGMPVLVNATIMVLAAVVLNAAFKWRRYPAAWGRGNLAAAPPNSADQLSHTDFVNALSRIGTFVDISEEEFLELRALMREEAERRRVKPEEIELGRFYSNGSQGPDFAVRWIVDQPATKTDVGIIWRVVAGRDRDATGYSTRQEFADWACCEVARSESTWIRANAQPISMSP